MRRRIVLLRHGEVDYFPHGQPVAAPRDVHLTERGRSQARAAGQVLHGISIDRAIASGLPRTLETAELVLGELSSRVPAPETWPELEEFRGGPVDDVASEDLEHGFLSAFQGVAPRHAQFLFGETIGSLLDRVNAELDRLLADHSWHTALLVLHGGVNRAILSRALTGSPCFLGHIEQAPACLNIIDHGPGWSVQAVNVTPSLPIHESPRTTTLEQMLDACRTQRRAER